MLLSGKALAESISHKIKLDIENLPGNTKPGLAVILIGEHPSSQTYVGVKQRSCERVGILSTLHHFPATCTENELLSTIDRLNHDVGTDGILIQLPLPPHINTQRVMERVDPKKDVDGFHPVNMGKLLLGVHDGFIPCTPLGIKVLLENSGIVVEGKHVVIIGRSAIVGKPLAALLMQKAPHCNASVTVLHSQSEHIKEIALSADILVAAVGIPRFIHADMVQEGAVVIDVGIHRETDPLHPKGYRIIGDVDFEAVEKKCSAITPVPKGVGPMTVAMLLKNTWLSFQKNRT